MHRVWEKKSQEAIKARVFDALAQNVNYDKENVLGIPASFLDGKVFSQDEFFLKDAPFISALVQNPNHIGCHTLSASENYFKGTQAIEQELIEICAVDILKSEPDQCDGYVASGGTEANLQAIWVYRNYYLEQGASLREICILCSTDSHYSMDKAANVFALDLYKVPVANNSRTISQKGVEAVAQQAITAGKKYFIVVCNMMTTMFGSVDTPAHYTDALARLGVDFKMHVDGAFGGFYYPFASNENNLTFQHPNITSFTLDAHKMAQAPYGTGIFIIKKGFIQYTNTQQASYVHGEDCTLIGSRSGANAIATWMILVKNGPFGWREKIFLLQKRTEWMCEQLTALNVAFYRHPCSNIITIKQAWVTPEIAHEFGLVPDNHAQPQWYKIVIMEHVTIEKLLPLVAALQASLPAAN